MSTRRIYAGTRLSEIRQGLGLTQTAFARQLDVSLSYLNQMERNNRPVSRKLIAALSENLGIDVSVFSMDEGDRLASDLEEALADPVFRDAKPSRAERQLISTNAPRLAHAFLSLHRAYRQGQERLASLDEALDRPASSPWPWEEVRDFFHYCDNYIDAIDRAAERFANEIDFSGPEKVARAVAWLRDKHGVHTRFEGDALRRFDATSRELLLSAEASFPTLAFQLAHQIGLIAHNQLIEATLDLGRFQTLEARKIAKLGLANHFAGAAILPYQSFHSAAQNMRHDLDALARQFKASLEQVGHRLSTLQRPGLRGVPFFFARVDQAGTITKRHSATRLQFARFGGACPLWNAHRAFETPGQILRQLAETPDGVRYLCLARDISHSGGHFRAPVRRYSIALGCEVEYADQLVYADDLDTSDDATFDPIGVSCRICERTACHQRAVPPVQRPLDIDPNRRDLLPYQFR